MKLGVWLYKPGDLFIDIPCAFGVDYATRSYRSLWRPKVYCRAIGVFIDCVMKLPVCYLGDAGTSDPSALGLYYDYASAFSSPVPRAKVCCRVCSSSSAHCSSIVVSPLLI